MKERFLIKNFSIATRLRIQQANEIITEYQAAGYTLTLRQLYYQFVSRALIANNMREYKNLGSIINDGRLAGVIDWSAIEDRTRNLERLPHWSSAKEILESCANQFRYDTWEDQPTRVEVWVEKEALAGVVERICKEWDVPWFACRGYVSQSEQYFASKRFAGYMQENNQDVLVLHLGDHDPSGIDMTRDNTDRMRMFLGDEFEDRFTLKRLALNEDQINKYKPPPNPVKLTDSRANDYREKFGEESWELDALEPKVLRKLIENEIDEVLDPHKWEDAIARREKAREGLTALAKKWKDPK